MFWVGLGIGIAGGLVLLVVVLSIAIPPPMR